MGEVTSRERAYFAAVGLLAAWVGFWGFFLPERVDTALPFLVPPLHARFLGSMYLSGLALMIGGLVSRRWSDVDVVPAMTAVWTGGLLVVSILHLDRFHLDVRTVIWFAAYAAYPVIGAWLIRKHRHDPAPAGAAAADPPVPAWMRRYLLAQAAVTTVLGVALFVAPGSMASAWPWPVPSFLAQVYAGPFLSFGVGSFLLARRRAVPELRVGVIAMLVFAAGVTFSSVVERDVFTGGAATGLWFTAFAVATVALAAASARSLRTASPVAA